ncbi:hypothetical protein ACIQBJ_14130 [Kitasatospora sp. NPDC088391]|uniref:hypothetical protein n=1 Tax=Kitasatospora sp. NPDC088391 TaxID=3364074 RepID=UPI00381EBE41
MPGNLQQPAELLHQLGVIASGIVNDHGLTCRFPGAFREVLVSQLAAAANAAPLIDEGYVQHLVGALQRIVRRARILLGYERDQQQFADMLCGCGGALTVDRSIDSGTVVRCAGTPDTRPCTTTYPWWQWADLPKGDRTAP